jgi:SAM-dependent methyltransferase
MQTTVFTKNYELPMTPEATTQTRNDAKVYVQYGCGLCAPKNWVNFDISPTLRIQKIPVIGSVLRRKLNIIFPAHVRYGDIVKGLPVEPNSCDGLYCSHTLEHLALNDLRIALKHSYDILKVGGIFRCVVPDLEFAARSYISKLENGNKLASLDFMNDTLLGIKTRPRNLIGFFSSFFGNSHHLWMWDKQSLSEALKEAHFRDVRVCRFNDCEDEMFKLVEDSGRFEHAVAIESRK